MPEAKAVRPYTEQDGAPVRERSAPNIPNIKVVPTQTQFNDPYAPNNQNNAPAQNPQQNQPNNQQGWQNPYNYNPAQRPTGCPVNPTYSQNSQKQSGILAALIVLLMPVVQVLLFGFAISVEVNNIDFAVVASHPTEAVRRQVERIAANPYFTFGGYIRQDEADEVLRTGEVGAVVVFADDYDRRTAGSGEPDGAAIQLIFDASNPNDASSGAGYLRSVLLAEGTGGAPTPELHLLYNPQMKSSYNFVPGLMGLIFMLICAMMTSVSIVREKETGTMEVLLVSPVRPLRIVVAKMIPYFLLSCVNLATILLLARFVLGVPMSGSVVGLVGLSLLYLVLALALGLFISTMADSQVTAMLISGMLLILPLIMLSGMVFPIENMPGVLQGISCIVPARWYIEAVRKLMVEGLPFAAVLKEFAVLAVMTGALIGVALGKFNDKLE